MKFRRKRLHTYPSVVVLEARHRVMPAWAIATPLTWNKPKLKIQLKKYLQLGLFLIILLVRLNSSKSKRKRNKILLSERKISSNFNSSILQLVCQLATLQPLALFSINRFWWIFVDRSDKISKLDKWDLGQDHRLLCAPLRICQRIYTYGSLDFRGKYGNLTSLVRLSFTDRMATLRTVQYYLNVWDRWHKSSTGCSRTIY